jgi:hypothetical protein
MYGVYFVMIEAGQARPAGLQASIARDVHTEEYEVKVCGHVAAGV